MSFVWTTITYFLYIEIIFVAILVLPVGLVPISWVNFIKSSSLAMSHQTKTYIQLILGVLCLFLLEAIGQMIKYSEIDTNAGQNLYVEIQDNMRLFRAERNFYISGLALFLTYVIRRLVAMISSQAPTTSLKKQADLEKKLLDLEKELVKERKDRDAMILEAERERRFKEFCRLRQENFQLKKKIIVSDRNPGEKNV